MSLFSINVSSERPLEGVQSIVPFVRRVPESDPSLMRICDTPGYFADGEGGLFSLDRSVQGTHATREEYRDTGGRLRSRETTSRLHIATGLGRVSVSHELPGFEGDQRLICVALRQGTLVDPHHYRLEHILTESVADSDWVAVAAAKAIYDAACGLHRNGALAVDYMGAYRNAHPLRANLPDSRTGLVPVAH